MLRIPLIILKDKQVFAPDGLSIMGKPTDIAKRLRDEGCKLIHIVDKDALKGSTSNLDVYDKLTYLINVEVECAPIKELVHSLLSLKCRVALRPPIPFDLGLIAERKLLVVIVKKDHAGSLEGFHDVILEDADEESVKRFQAMGLRVIVMGRPPGKSKPFGSIISS